MSEREKCGPGPADMAKVRKDGETWKLLLVKDLRHPPEKVWRALTEPAHLREWAPFDASGDLGKVGAVEVTWVGAPAPIEARVTRAGPPKLLEYAVAELDQRSRAEDFWTDPEAAQKAMKRLADLRAETDEIRTLGAQLADARELLEIMGDEEGTTEEVDASISAAQERVDGLEMAANFDREYDDHGAIVSIHAGAGGSTPPTGGDARAHVPALGRAQGFHDADRRRVAGRRSRPQIGRVLQPAC